MDIREPWKVEKTSRHRGATVQPGPYITVVDSDGRDVAWFMSAAGEQLTRAVACVNACAGIPTDMLMARIRSEDVIS